jgi:molybdopterin/thiamine biosynthesis adenylyltransferase
LSRAQTRVLIVGVGGIGCPAALAMARAGVRTIGLCDDDKVERGNLHRQILFTESDADARTDKVDAAAKALRAMGCSAELRLHRTRLLPGNATDLVREYDIVLEGADNFATKFLAADACVLSGIPVVHASAVRWVATALAVGPRGGPCYRCLFEDLPADGAPGCADAGVMGPVVGIIAAAQSDLALALIDGMAVEGQLVTFDGRADVLRRRAIAPRPDCDLCGLRPRIRHVESQAYLAPSA